MNRIISLSLLNCIVFAFFAIGTSEAAETRPNILVIVGDDMG